MRALAPALALLSAVPVLAADHDGTYRGEAEFVAGRSDTCRGMSYAFDVRGNAVKGKLTPPAGGEGVGGTVSGTLRADGTVTMSYTVVNQSKRVEINLTLAGDTIAGFSQSQTCRYKITAKRS